MQSHTPNRPLAMCSRVVYLGVAVLGTTVLGLAVLGVAVLGTAVLHPQPTSLLTQHSLARPFPQSISNDGVA